MRNWIFLFLVLMSTAAFADEQTCTPTSSSPIPFELQCKVFVGYQGWFRTPNDELTPTSLAPQSFTPGLMLTTGQSAGSLTTAPGVVLTLLKDGNLVLYDYSRRARWETKTIQDCSSSCFMLFQVDGNIVLYHNNKAYWSSNNVNASGRNLVLRDKPPYLQVTDTAGKAIWSSSISGPGWAHWSVPAYSPISAKTLTVDMWPDVREYDPRSLETIYPVKDGTIDQLGNGQPSQLFSSLRPETIDLHLKWMQQYGIDGLFLERFVTGMGSPFSKPRSHPTDNNKVLNQIRISAQKYDRQFAVMYDISNAFANPNCYEDDPDTLEPYLPVPSFGAAARGFSLAKCVEEDWMNLVDHWSITRSKAYLKIKDKPVVELWGLGMDSTEGCLQRGCRYIVNTADAMELIQWFQKDAPVQYQAIVMGGTPVYWRTQTKDSLADEDAPEGQPTWTQVYQALDIISPWMPGRESTLADVDTIAGDTVKGDVDAVLAGHQGYMPVIFPGYSFYNQSRATIMETKNILHGRQFPLNQVSGLCGKFIWEQFSQLYQLGINTFYIGMFDDVNEGEAIFKTAPSSQLAPNGAAIVTLDEGGACSQPGSDWYLQLTSQMSQMVKSTTPFQSNIPGSKDTEE